MINFSSNHQMILQSEINCFGFLKSRGNVGPMNQKKCFGSSELIIKNRLVHSTIFYQASFKCVAKTTYILIFNKVTSNYKNLFKWFIGPIGVGPMNHLCGTNKPQYHCCKNNGNL